MNESTTPEASANFSKGSYLGVQKEKLFRSRGRSLVGVFVNATVMDESLYETADA